jgi:regulator of protease activity HflC (stomatin/prohibitin superfamily)
MAPGVIAAIAVLLGLLVASIRILREYERGVIFMLGRFWKVKGPGLIIVIPLVQAMVRVDLRTVVMDVPSQDVISRDNVSVKVNAVIYFRVLDPERAIIQVLAARDKLNKAIQTLLDSQTDTWGIKVANVEIKHVDIDESMIRAIAKQAEAERERRAKVIHAEGEQQAAAKLVEAAKQLATQPSSMQLRYLQTLVEIAGEKNSTIVFPLPIDIIGRLVSVKQDSV